MCCVTGTGFKELGGERMKSSDPMHLGSNGKLMTAVLIARLEERGLLGLDRPIGRLLDRKVHPQLAAVTPRMLLRHQAGLPSGRVMARLPRAVAATLPASFGVTSGLTPYVRFGEWPVLLSLFILVGLRLGGGRLTALETP